MQSGMAMSVGEMLPRIPASIISMRSSAPSLSNKNVYPTFLRTDQSASIFARVRTTLLPPTLLFLQQEKRYCCEGIEMEVMCALDFLASVAFFCFFFIHTLLSWRCFPVFHFSNILHSHVFSHVFFSQFFILQCVHSCLGRQIFFNNCIVSLGFLPWKIWVALPGESQLQQSLTTQPMVHARCFSVPIIHQTVTWTTECLTCSQMLMHTIVNVGVKTHVRESTLKIDWERMAMNCNVC